MVKLKLLIGIVLISALQVASGEFRKPNKKEGFGYVYTSYNLGITCTSSFAPVHPKSLEEIQHLIHFALKSNLTVKAVGSKHSISDAICTDGIPLDLSSINHFSYDPDTGYATAGAGAKVRELFDSLHSLGRALSSTPMYSDITIGGAIATGAHGSTLQFPASLSDQMVSLKVVDGLGNVKTITNPKTVDAFRTHLGLLGILYEVTFKTIPQFKLHAVTKVISDNVLFSNPSEIIKMARDNAYFRFQWYPSNHQIVAEKSEILPTDSKGDCKLNFFRDVPRSTSIIARNLIEALQAGMIDIAAFFLQTATLQLTSRPIIPRFGMYSTNDGRNCHDPTGFSHQITSGKCNVCIWQHGNDSVYTDVYQVAIPLEELGPAIKTISNILQEYPTQFYMGGIVFRFLSPSTGILNTNRGREVVAIEWGLPARVDRYSKAKFGLPASQAMVRALVAQHQGRTHWGKNGLYFSSPEMIQFQHPGYRDQFIDYMRQMDPFGVFLNDFGRRLRFSERKMTLDPRVTHCALSEHCTCASNKDCGDGKRGDYICGSVYGYNVCKENLSMIGRLGRIVGRKTVRKMGMVQNLGMNTFRFTNSLSRG